MPNNGVSLAPLYGKAQIPKGDTFIMADFDLGQFQADWEAANPAEETETEETEDETSDDQTASDESEEDESDAEESEQDDQETDQDGTEEEADDSDDQTASDEDEPVKGQSKEQNAAFAEMRRQLKEAEKYKKFTEKLAAGYGLQTPDQVLEAYEQQQQAEEAKKAGIPVEILQKLNAQQAELEQLKQSTEEAKFEREVQTVADKYGLGDTEVKNAYQYMKDHDLVDAKTLNPKVNFEDAYKLANFETLTKASVEKAKQKSLAEKKKRQESTALGHNGGTSDTGSNKTDDITPEFIKKYLEQNHIN